MLPEFHTYYLVLLAGWAQISQSLQKTFLAEQNLRNISCFSFCGPGTSEATGNEASICILFLPSKTYFVESLLHRKVMCTACHFVCLLYTVDCGYMCHVEAPVTSHPPGWGMLAGLRDAVMLIKLVFGTHAHHFSTNTGMFSYVQAPHCNVKCLSLLIFFNIQHIHLNKLKHVIKFWRTF